MTKYQVRARLIERESSYAKFSRDNGYDPRLVQQVVVRYTSSDKEQPIYEKPRGILTYKILRDLSAFIGEPIIEGLDELVS